MAAPTDPILARIARARARLTDESHDRSLALVVPDPAAQFEPFSLTDLQQAYWFAHLASGPVAGGAFMWAELIASQEDIEHANRIWRLLIARHDTLRSTIRSDGMWQVSREVPEFQLETFDLRGLPAHEREAELAKLRNTVVTVAPDPSGWPLFTLRQARMDHESRLFMTSALVLSDWNSIDILGLEGEMLRRNLPLPQRAITFRDYAVALPRLVETTVYKRSLEFWLARATALPPGPSLPMRREPVTYSWIEPSHTVPRALYQQLLQRAAGAGVSIAALFLAALGDVLARWGGPHFTITMLLQNRLPLHPEVDSVVGNLSGTLPIEIDATVAEPFYARVRRLQTRLESDLEHRWLNGVALAREVNRARGTNAPMSRVAFSSRLSNATLPTKTWLGTPVGRGVQTSEVWLDVQAVRNAHGDAIVVFSGREDVYVAGLLEDLTEAHARLLERLASDDSAWQDRHPVVLGGRQLEARDRANATATPVPLGLLHEPLLATAARTPNRPAVITPGRTLSYGELARAANALAHRLVERDVGANQLVAVAMEKGWEQVVAVLGILESGAAYLPIDVRLIPQKRLELLLRHGEVRVVVTQASIASSVEWPSDVEVIAIDDDFGAEHEMLAVPVRQIATDLAYVIYTSGSTGTPKGVMIDHQGALNTCVDIARRFHVTQHDRVLGLSSLSFDLSVFDIFGVLGIGGVLVLPASSSLRSPDEWLDLVRSSQVTVWNSVPKLLEMMVDYIGERSQLWPTSLRLAMLSGDWIPLSLPGRVRALSPSIDLVSLGGATEASIWSCYHEIREIEPGWTSIPYGRGLANQTLHVYDQAMKPAPIWVTGDIYIGGIGLAQGYWRDTERTAEAFRTHPETGERLYRTGDLGRVMPNGEVEFLGRRDAQVKIRGYRIELGEIEAALTRHPDVAQCYVMVREADPSAAGRRGDRMLDPGSAEAIAARRVSDKKLVAYLVPQPTRVIENEAIRQFAAQHLPDYMVPTVIMAIDAIPLSPNGKVDRRALPAPELPVAAAGRELPSDPFERAVVELVGHFLGRTIGVDENFFESGGDSVRLIKMLARVRQRFGREVRVSDFIAEPTARALTNLIRDERHHGLRHVIPLRAGTRGTPVALIHPVGGSALVYLGLTEELEGDRAIYGVQAQGLEGDDEPLKTMEAMADAYAKELLTAIPEGPIVLAGWSLGGTVSLEVADRIRAAGRYVPLIVLMDSWAPVGQVEPVAEDDRKLVEWFLRDLHGRLDSTGAISSDAKDASEALAYAHAHGQLPAELTLDEATRRFRVYASNALLARAHVPRSWPGRTVLLRAESLPPSDFAVHPALRRPAVADPTSGWGMVCPQLEVHAIAGDHYTLLAPAHLRTLAALLDREIASATSDIGVTS